MNSNEKPLKVLFYDIENIARPEHIFRTVGRFQRPAGFCSDLAYILVFGYKWLGEKSANYLIRKKKSFKSDPIGDEELLQDIFSIMSEADVIVSWYGSGHDYKFLTTRLAQKGLYLDPRIKHIDLYQTAKKRFSMSSNRLNNVAKFFGCELKTDVSHNLWPKTWAGDYDALLEMADYCAQDCEVLEQVYQKMYPLVTNLPPFYPANSNTNSCPHCDSQKTIKWGRRVQGKKFYQRRQCMDCLTYFRGEAI